MMKIEENVCLFWQAKRLNQLGVKSNSMMVWAKEREDGKYHPVIAIHGILGGKGEKYPAFTSSELHGLLPHELIDTSNVRYVLSATKDFDYYSQSYAYQVGYYNFEIRKWYYGHGDKSMAIAAAEILIRIIEQSVISIDLINQIS